MTEIQLFKDDKDIQAFFTEKIVHWLLKNQYSKDHWQTVHAELIETHPDASKEEIILKFGNNLESFHIKYRDAVVKEDNLFHDIITACYSQVDWVAVSRIFISSI